MAKVTGGAVTVELSRAELELICRALGLVKNFGEVDDWDSALELLADLEAE